MKVIIMGCGRVGSQTARILADDGHQVTIIDPDATALARLGTQFKGRTVQGVGFDRAVLIEAGNPAAARQHLEQVAQGLLASEVPSDDLLVALKSAKAMKERAQLSSGIFTLESYPGKGTCIQVVWPNSQ